jgi:hypothetical protein
MPALLEDPLLDERVAAVFLEQRLLCEQLKQAACSREGWLWQGYLATGKTTLLTSQWKSGKSSLVAVLLARMGKGGVLAGLPVTAGRVAMISEEGPGVWDERCCRLGIGKHVSFFCQPFKAKPTLEEWHGLLDAMLLLRRREGLDLVVIDTLATFLPGGNENAASVMMNCLLPLRELKAEGVGVLLVHHPRKGTTAPGQAARGSGALPGYVDILMEMGWVGRPEDEDRRRWVRAFSRFEQTRRQTVLELSADGRDYRDCGPLPDEATSACAEVLRLVLEETNYRLTRRQILEQWPEDYARPDRGTLGRALNRASADGWVHQRGSGRKTDPFRYWLPERIEDLHPGDGASREAVERWQQRMHRKIMARLAEVFVPSEPQPAAAKPAPVVSGEAKEQREPDVSPAAARVTGETPPPQAPSVVSPQEPALELPRLPGEVIERLRTPEVDPKVLAKERVRLRQWPRQ